MKKKLLLLAAAIIAFCYTTKAQVTTEPTPIQEDSQDVTIFFHADEGNKGLINMPATTHIYAHTGVCVVDQDGKTTDWKYAPEWELDDPKYQLEYVSENLWKLYIGDIRSFYGVADNETVTKLCFVFRNTGGTKKGNAEGNKDIFVDVLESGFQMTFKHSIASDVLYTPKSLRLTATTTEPASVQIFLNDKLLGEGNTTETSKNFRVTHKFDTPGQYVMKAVANNGKKTITQTINFLYANGSVKSSETTPPALGVTKNAKGDYVFCFAAPEKQNVLLFGSWNNYAAMAEQEMQYIDQTIDGATFRFFTVTLPSKTTGNKFGYYFLVDGENFNNPKNVADPYCRLALDPYNDKYIKPSVYPDMPEYPQGEVPNNCLVSWYADDLLDYDWQVKDFKGAPKDNLVIYELLFRDFTGTEGKALGNGTVRKAIEKIPYLKKLGVNAIELLPINEFDGNVSWGYNPNFYFATDKAYGTPQDYKEFIDICHQNGIAVILDVVFNQSAGLHPWYQMYDLGKNPFYNSKAPHAYSVLNDFNQGYPLVERQWADMLKFWLSEYKVDGFRFDLVKGLGDNISYSSSSESATNSYNASRVARMKRLHDAIREVNPDAYFINENLAGAKEENEMAADGELNWANVNYAGCQFAMGYTSESSLSRMWAVKDSRTAGSTVAYLESHDEQRLAYKQKIWGVSGVKGNTEASTRRLGAAAAQMILAPGSHMIWMFSEMGNDQNTKDATGGNNTDPKIVNWDALQQPEYKGLVNNYRELIGVRLANTDLFAADANYTAAVTTSNWKKGRSIFSTTADKELYAVINPNVSEAVTMTVNFRSDNNNAYHIVSKSYDSNPSFDAAAQTVTVEPNCYVVLASDNVSGIEEVSVSGADNADNVAIYALQGAISVANCDSNVTVYTLDGATIASAHGNATFNVNPGLYIVKAGNNTAKVLVK